MSQELDVSKARKQKLLVQDGRFWFSGETERRFYFILTVIMLIIGILYKTGVI